MLRLLPGIIASALAAFAGIYGLLWLVCYISDHDSLVMLHMYSSSTILSVAFGVIMPLNIRKLPVIFGVLRKECTIQSRFGRVSSTGAPCLSGQNLFRHIVVTPRFQFAVQDAATVFDPLLPSISHADRDGGVTLRSSLVCRLPDWNGVLVVISRPLALMRLTCRGRH